MKPEAWPKRKNNEAKKESGNGRWHLRYGLENGHIMGGKNFDTMEKAIKFTEQEEFKRNYPRFTIVKKS